MHDSVKERNYASAILPLFTYKSETVRVLF
jgi:hypothetical protein